MHRKVLQIAQNCLKLLQITKVKKIARNCAPQFHAISTNFNQFRPILPNFFLSFELLRSFWHSYFSPARGTAWNFYLRAISTNFIQFSSISTNFNQFASISFNLRPIFQKIIHKISSLRFKLPEIAWNCKSCQNCR